MDDVIQSRGRLDSKNLDAANSRVFGHDANVSSNLSSRRLQIPQIGYLL
jgi:hypothetical protein